MASRLVRVLPGHLTKDMHSVLTVIVEGYDTWLAVRQMIDFVCTIWQDQDMSIWEVRRTMDRTLGSVRGIC